MRPIAHTLTRPVRAPIEHVFAVLTDPDCFPDWLPGCSGIEVERPLKKGARFKTRFGSRVTELEVIDFAPPRTFGWIERGDRKGDRTFFGLEASGDSTTVTVRVVWAPRSFLARLRGRLFEKRQVQRQLERLLQNLQDILAS